MSEAPGVVTSVGLGETPPVTNYDKGVMVRSIHLKRQGVLRIKEMRTSLWLKGQFIMIKY